MLERKKKEEEKIKERREKKRRKKKRGGGSCHSLQLAAAIESDAAFIYSLPCMFNRASATAEL